MPHIPRILFNAHNRRGLGHFMRGLNIAREVRRVLEADIRFYTRSATAASLCDPNFVCFVDHDTNDDDYWKQVLKEFAPNVVVYDTLLPKDRTAHQYEADVRLAYVMRKCKPDKQAEIFADPFLDRIDLILIPHTETEFGYALPVPLQTRAHYTGPIVRIPDADSQARLRTKYALREDECLLVSTVGGGGFADRAAAFFELIREIHTAVSPALPRLRHLVIQGPNFSGEVEAVPGMEVIGTEPDLVNLLALADLIIAEGGYNTVNEIRMARTPAIFLPSVRNFDDQLERVQALAEQGTALVFSESGTSAIAPAIVGLLQQPARLAILRAAYAKEGFEPGNREAGRRLAALACT